MSELEIPSGDTFTSEFKPLEVNDEQMVQMIKLFEFDEDGEVTKEAVLSENYHLDVLWDLSDSTDEDGELIKADHPHGWKSASVDLDSNGVHSFFGIDYLAHKI